MPHPMRKIAGPALATAGLMASLIAISEASAQERITLEAIGAVRMADAAELRRANTARPPAEAGPARERVAERTAPPR